MANPSSRKRRDREIWRGKQESSYITGHRLSVHPAAPDIRMIMKPLTLAEIEEQVLIADGIAVTTKAALSNAKRMTGSTLRRKLERQLAATLKTTQEIRHYWEERTPMAVDYTTPPWWMQGKSEGQHG